MTEKHKSSLKVIALVLVGAILGALLPIVRVIEVKPLSSSANEIALEGGGDIEGTRCKTEGSTQGGYQCVSLCTSYILVMGTYYVCTRRTSFWLGGELG